MEELMELLKDRPVMYLATVEGYYPRVRPVNHYMIYKGLLYLALCKDKEAYKQLLDNTNLELCVALDDTRMLRIQGTVNFDRNPETYEAAYMAMPDLKDAYPEDTGKHLALVYLDHISAVLFDRQDEGKVLAHF
ncbi:pyridoxamine 5'-phosphate oxidase family protein [uncultured Allofournierella sp.]|uniref:pyridoxamine 5'-phosphate oxidase family protein n=1 Tax=uncultured Allofournierella sp. TaxID=1940258 RepID=UPI003752ED31